MTSKYAKGLEKDEQRIYRENVADKHRRRRGDRIYFNQILKCNYDIDNHLFTPSTSTQWRSYTGACAPPSAFQAPSSVNVVTHVIRRDNLSQLGMQRLCRHNFGHNRYVWESGIMLAF